MKKLLLFSCFAAVQTLYGQSHYVDSLHNVLVSAVPDTVKMCALSDLCYELFESDTVEARKYVDKLDSMAMRAGFVKGRIWALNIRGVIEVTKSNYDAAISFFLKEAELAGREKQLALRADAYNNVAIVYERIADYNKAIENYLAGLKIREQLGLQPQIAESYNNLGIVYYNQNKIPQAIENMEASLAIKRKLGNKKAISVSCRNLSDLYTTSGDLKHALSLIQEALQLARETQDTRGEAYCWLTMSDIYQKSNERDKSLAALKHVQDLEEKLDDKILLANIHAILARNLMSYGKYKEAMQEAEMVMTNGREAKSTQTIRDCYILMADIASAAGNYKDAYNYHLKYTLVADSLLNEENTKQVAEMQTRYETEKKNRELLVKDAEISRNEADAKQKSMERNALVAVLLLMGGLLFFIFRSSRQKQRANIEISNQKAIIEEKNKEITDSIQYAKRIQGSLLASGNLLQKNLGEHFVFYKPKDIVSGDFYWAYKSESGFLLCAADCTGHGVPGAFMSLLTISKLNEIVGERRVTEPDKVLNEVRSEIIHVLNPEGAAIESRDGMDCCLCQIDFSRGRLVYAAANNPLWLLRGNTILEFAADKMPVGVHAGAMNPFTAHEILLQKGDIVYLLTDGYADQFGGEKGKKFKYKPLQDLLIKNSHLPMQEQSALLEEHLSKWRGNLEQVDDILLIGIKVK